MKGKGSVAIIHFGFFYSGGGERLVLEEVKGLRKRGFEAECFSPVVDKHRCYPELIRKIKPKALLPQLPRWFPEREPIQILAACILVPLYAFRLRKFDVILGANQPGPWIAWVIRKILRKPYVVYLAQPTRLLHPRKVDRETGFWLKKKLRIFPILAKVARPYIRRADEISIGQASKVLTNGEYISGVIKKTYAINNAVCPAGADAAKQQELVTKKWDGEVGIKNCKIKKPFILLTNRHFPQKRFEHAITAMPIVLSSVPEASLVITGEETEYTKYLKEVTDHLELRHKVHFVGLVSEKDLKKLYLNAACYVYTSPQEDFGMGIVEAMAHGTVPIAWRKGGPRYIIKGEKTGFLAKPFQISDLAKKISRVLQDRNLNQRVSNNGWVFVKKHLSFENHNKLLGKTLTDVIRSEW
jgi:glycosyltransferase involved in cell wall biosynthesis